MSLRPIFAAALLAAAATRAAAQQPAAPPTVLFRNVRVFDGARAVAGQDVLVRGGKIARVGRGVAAPAGAQTIDGAGKTLLPGLIDAHTHAFADALAEALVFGVTTELDMFSDYRMAATMRAEQAAGRATGRADLYSAGTLVTAPKGHGTEYGMTIPTITSADSAQAFVDARIAEGSDYIKIVYDDGHTYGMVTPTISMDVMRAVVAAAHKRGKLAVVHIGSLQQARDAIEAGADGLVHLFVDLAPDAAFGRFVAQHHAFVVPTLTVNMSITGTGGGAPLATDARLTSYLTPTSRAMLAQAFPRRPGLPPVAYANAEAAVKLLKAAGVPILAGTDAGNPGTVHGAALHRELELLVQAGLTPSEALAAATATPARLFGLADRGRIAEGLRADLVLVDGDPTADITATRAIVGVWKAGVPLDRAAYARTVAAAQAAVGRAPTGAESGAISDFDDGTTGAKFGAGWMVSTDVQAGGKSAAEMRVVEGGAAGTARALSITGTVGAGLAYAWAGAMFSPGAQVFAPANLGTKKEIVFWAKGDGATYRVMLFAQSKGMMPLTRTFVAGPAWAEVVMPFSAFGTDGSDLMAIIIAAGPQPGPFAISIDQVRLR